MKSKVWIVAGLVVAMGGPTAMAEKGRDGNPPPAMKSPRSGSEEMFKNFDADGDGKISEAEQQTMHQAMSGRNEQMGRPGPPGPRPNREAIMKRFDADGDGVLSESERETMHTEWQRIREVHQKRFDADGDGQLNEEERKTMHETLRAERPAPPPEEGGTE